MRIYRFLMDETIYIEEVEGEESTAHFRTCAGQLEYDELFTTYDIENYGDPSEDIGRIWIENLESNNIEELV